MHRFAVIRRFRIEAVVSRVQIETCGSWLTGVELAEPRAKASAAIIRKTALAWIVQQRAQGVGIKLCGLGLMHTLELEDLRLMSLCCGFTAARRAYLQVKF